MFVERSKMPDRCVVSVVANCSKTLNTVNGIFVHMISFFRDCGLKRRNDAKTMEGLNEDKLKLAQPTKHSVVNCSQHFKPGPSCLKNR